MLRDIQTYIAKHHTVSMADLTLHFQADEEAIEPMVNKLFRKGRVRKIPVPEQCGGCSCCSPSGLELYEWTGQAAGVISLSKLPWAACPE